MNQPYERPSPLRGILPVLATPFKDDSGSENNANQVAEDDILHTVDFVIQAGAHGLVFPGVASEFNYLTADERHRLAALVSERVNGRVPIVVGASAETSADAIALARAGLEVGACAAMIMAPAGLGSRPEPIINFFKTIGQDIGIPIILQNAPPPVGSGLSIETIADVVFAVPSIRYVKEETLPSGQRITRLLDAAPNHLLGILGGGGARYVVDELNRGACGAMPACELTDIHTALYQAHQAGDLLRARHLYNRTLPLLLMQAVFRMRMTKEVLRLRGIIRHVGLRAPLPDWDDQDRRELRILLAEVEDLFTVGSHE